MSLYRRSINGSRDYLKADLRRTLPERFGPLPDVRLHVGPWSHPPTVAEMKAQEAFAEKGMAEQARIVEEARPYVCGPCGMRYETEEEAYECCEGSIENQFDIGGKSAIPPEKLAKVEKLFADGYSMTAALTAIHLPDYRVRPYWNLMRDELMEREGLAGVIDYHHWRRKRLKERGVWYQDSDSGRFKKKVKICGK